jgi:D-alanyl-D-alanine carboxypeptidase (penicillin-binding protein 5/6)
VAPVPPTTAAAQGTSWQSKVPRDFASAILVEAETGQVLYEVNPHLQRAPASTTKIMTALVVMEQIEAGKVSLSDRVRVTRRARGMGGTQVYLAEGEVFSLEDLMKAVLIASANDAAVAVAEHVGGTYENFIRLMNEKAKELGLRNSHFRNVHGLDLPSKRNIVSAYDLAQIARELVKYPKVIEWTSTRSAPFRDGKFMLNNTNRLLGRIEHMDGLKTGFTSRAGFCLVATGEQRGMRLIAVILGARTSEGRFRSARHLLQSGLTRFQLVRYYDKGEPVGLEVPIAGGKSERIPLIAGKTLAVVVPREHVPRIEKKSETVGLVAAPIQAGTPLGFCELFLGSQLLARVPAVAPHDVSRASLIDRLWQGLGFGRYETGGTAP